MNHKILLRWVMMKKQVIKLSELEDYFQLSKKEFELENAIRNYNRIRALVSASRKNVKELVEEYEDYKSKCEFFIVDKKLQSEIKKVKLWKRN